MASATRATMTFGNGRTVPAAEGLEPTLGYTLAPIGWLRADPTVRSRAEGSMPEILTESFCERCGTRYTFEAAAPKGKRLGKLKVFSKGFVNFVSNDETSIDEAFAEARSDEQRELTSRQLDAFHQTFQFCMSCRQYTCANCWNEAESRCLSCAPNLGTDILQGPFPDLDPLARIFNAPYDEGLNGNGHANGDGDGEQISASEQAAASAWPTIDLGAPDAPALALSSGLVEADLAPADGADAEPAAADAPPADAASAAEAPFAATAADAPETAASIDDDVAEAVQAAEQARRMAVDADAERERVAAETARQAAQAAERAEAERAETERAEAARDAAEADRAREATRIEDEESALARAAIDSADQERRAGVEAAQAEERARTADAEHQQQVAADAAAERERKVAAEAERQRVAFEGEEQARQAATLAAAATVAPAAPPPAEADADRAAAAAEPAKRDRDDRVGSPAWQMLAPDATGIGAINRVRAANGVPALVAPTRPTTSRRS